MKPIKVDRSVKQLERYVEKDMPSSVFLICSADWHIWIMQKESVHRLQFNNVLNSFHPLHYCLFIFAVQLTY